MPMATPSPTPLLGALIKTCLVLMPVLECSALLPVLITRTQEILAGDNLYDVEITVSDGTNTNALKL